MTRRAYSKRFLDKNSSNKETLKVGRALPAFVATGYYGGVGPGEPEQGFPMKCAEIERSSLLALHMVFPLLRLSTAADGGLALIAIGPSGISRGFSIEVRAMSDSGEESIKGSRVSVND